MSRIDIGNKYEASQSNFRIDIIDAQTLEKTRSLYLSKGKIRAIIAGSVLAVTLLTAALMAFSPVRQWIPGYSDIERNPTFLTLHKNLLQLEKAAEAQNRYIQSLQRIVTIQGEQNGNKSVSKGHTVEATTLSNRDYSLMADIEDPVISNTTRRVEELYLVPPLKGIIGANFLKEKNHLGIDIIAPAETPIKSILSGHVIFSDWTLETGYSIGIQHSYGLVSFYKHNAALLKTMGDYINAGEAIAVIGNTGELTSGPHLHFEMWRDGKPINPKDYITFD